MQYYYVYIYYTVSFLLHALMGAIGGFGMELVGWYEVIFGLN